MRVDDSRTDVSVTFGEAVNDRDDLLGLSRPRTASLVDTFTFDAAAVLQMATLKGPLTHVTERRRIQSLSSGWTAALEGAAGALRANQAGRGAATGTGRDAIRRARRGAAAPGRAVHDGYDGRAAVLGGHGDGTRGGRPSSSGMTCIRGG
jgi:hypothetical protein